MNIFSKLLDKVCYKKDKLKTILGTISILLVIRYYTFSFIHNNLSSSCIEPIETLIETKYIIVQIGLRTSASNEDSINSNHEGNNQDNKLSKCQKFDETKFERGSSPFKKYNYKDTTVVTQDIGFNKENRLPKSFDKHVKSYSGIIEYKNK